MEITTWPGCYDESWKGLITEDAFAHPAKFAPGLIKRILAHGLERGWWNSEIKLIVSPDLLKYLLCQIQPETSEKRASIADAEFAISQLDAAPAATKKSHEGGLQPAESMPYAPPVNANLLTGHPPQKPFAPSRARTIADPEESGERHAAYVGGVSSAPLPENIVALDVSQNTTLEISIRKGKGKPGRPSGKKGTQELAAPDIGSGEAGSGKLTTASSGSESVRKLGLLPDDAYVAENLCSSKPITPSHTEYQSRIAGTGLRRFVLDVTPELMSILIECCENSASRTSVVLLKNSSNLVLSLHRFEDGASAKIEASLVGDPFGGIAGGGVMAGYAGLNWVGVELEPQFHAMGLKNIQLHAPTWLACGDASFVKLVQGDSRQFAKIVGEAAAGGWQKRRGVRE